MINELLLTHAVLVAPDMHPKHYLGLVGVKDHEDRQWKSVEPAVVGDWTVLGTRCELVMTDYHHCLLKFQGGDGMNRLVLACTTNFEPDNSTTGQAFKAHMRKHAGKAVERVSSETIRDIFSDLNI